MAETRKIFIYLSIIAVVLGLIGILGFENKGILGKTIQEQEKKASMDDIKKHNSPENCWIVSENKVYDITLFLQIYPEDLSGKCGGDLGSFKQEDVSLLEQYKIGELE